MRENVRELRDRLSRHLNVGRAAGKETSADDSNGAAQMCVVDRLIADGLATPALAAKFPRGPLRISSEGTVSDLVADQRR